MHLSTGCVPTRLRCRNNTKQTINKLFSLLPHSHRAESILGKIRWRDDCRSGIYKYSNNALWPHCFWLSPSCHIIAICDQQGAGWHSPPNNQGFLAVNHASPNSRPLKLCNSLLFFLKVGLFVIWWVRVVNRSSTRKWPLVQLSSNPKLA